MRLGSGKPSFWTTLKSVKHIEWVAVLLVGGLLVMLLFSVISPPRAGEGLLPVMAPAATETPARTEMEKRLEDVLSLVEGAGAVRVVIAQDDREATCGVIVVAEGAGALGVRVELARAVQSLLGVPQSNIEVLPMAKPIEDIAKDE